MPAHDMLGLAMKSSDRESLTEDVIGIVVGLGGIAVALRRLGNDIDAWAWPSASPPAS